MGFFSLVKKTPKKMVGSLGKMNGSLEEDVSPPTAAPSSDAVAHQRSPPAEFNLQIQGSGLHTGWNKKCSSSFPDPKRDNRSTASRFRVLNPLKPQKNNEQPPKKLQPQRAPRNSLQEDVNAADNQRHDQNQWCSSWRYPQGGGGGRFYRRGGNGNPNNYYAREEEFERRGRYMPRLRRGRTDGTLVRDNEVVGYDPSEVVIGERNRGGRRIGGRVSGNVVIR